MDEALIDAYRATNYRVTEGRTFTLKVDEPSPELERLYEERGLNSAAFITACNPGSRMVGDAENRQRMERLAADVAALGLTALRGVGEDPAGAWPGEPSFLVLGVSPEQAQDLGRKYGQNAIIWCGPDAVPRLVWLGS